MAGLEQMSPAARKTVALGLFVALLALLLGWVLLPLYRWSFAATERLADSRFELARAQAGLNPTTTMPSAEINRREQELTAWLLPTAREADAAAAFQANAGSVLASQGLVVESLAARPSSDLGPMRLLALDWRGTGSEAALASALAAIEGARPAVRIDRLHIQRTQSASGTRDAASAPLLVELRLVALWAPPEGPATSNAKTLR